MRDTRIKISTPELDKEEMEWWNKNAGTIETIWAQTYALQSCIRKPYLLKAKKFLQGDNDKTMIWEVGCGTGWVCRMIADENFHVTGTDFSQSQIQIARDTAAAFGKEKFCNYLLTDASTLVENHNGILISALLHHLSEQELEKFFTLFESQKKGTKVFMYEPVFIEAKSNNGQLIALLYKQVPKLFRTLTGVCIALTGKKNRDLDDKVNALYSQAEKNNWFLSPKEVPFYESELDNYLNRYFTIQKTYFVNKSDLHIAQNMVIYNKPEPGFIFRKIIFPLSIFLDRIFFALNFRSVTKGQYFFKCFELIVK